MTHGRSGSPGVLMLTAWMSLEMVSGAEPLLHRGLAHREVEAAAAVARRR